LSLSLPHAATNGARRPQEGFGAARRRYFAIISSLQHRHNVGNAVSLNGFLLVSD